MAKWDYLIEGDKELKAFLQHSRHWGVHKKCFNCDKNIIDPSRFKYCSKKCSGSATNKKWRKDHPGAYAKEKKAYNERHPEKKRARDLKSALKRGKAQDGRICKSCGLSDIQFAKAGMTFGDNRTTCKRCNAKKQQYGLCVNNIHVLPGKVDFTKRKAHNKQDYPKCLCTPGNIKPDYLDPNNKYPPRIPFKDKDIPEFNYTALATRKKGWLEMTTGGEGITRGKQATSKERKKQGGKWVPGVSGGSRKGSSSKSPRRSTRGGSPFDVGPRRSRDV